MDRLSIYDEWRRKSVNGEALCDERTISLFKKLSDKNFKYYFEYHQHLFSNTKISIYKNKRSKILDFLTFPIIVECDLENVTQSMIDIYFESFENEMPNTTNTRVYHLRDFMNFLSLADNIDFEKYKKPIDQKEVKKMSRISAEQISAVRDKYKEDPKTLFVFEMILYSPFSNAEIGQFQIDDVDFINNTIYKDGEAYAVPVSLINLIYDMHSTGILYEPHDVMSTINRLRKDMATHGLGKLTAKDGKETRKTLFWACPQCGHEYEAIAENWCVKQYREDGENWVVCRKRCGHV